MSYKCMRVISESNWNWMLYQDDDEYYLVVVCGSVAIYETVIQLAPSEVESYLLNGSVYIETLATKIRNTSSEYSDRNIKNFDANPPVQAATQAWRSAHAKQT